MYESFFGLKRRPFSFIPDLESYFSVESREESHQEIELAVKKGEGFSLIFGASGTGKTLLLRRLQKSFEPEYTVAFVSHSRLETPRALFLQLFHDLHISDSEGDTIELRLQLLDFARQEPTKGVVLLFDDAQYLGPAVLEEIRLLSDSVDGSVDGSMPLFRAVLAGTMEFEEKLTLPNLEVLNQRVAVRCYLDSFSNEDTSRYIVRQTDHLRIDLPHQAFPPLFTEEAKRRIYQLTDGVPRLINQLCESSLQCAAARRIKSIDGSLVNAAWLNLNHLESDDTSAQSDSLPVQESVISAEQIEEIVDRKKHIFQLRHFDSVEFGALSDSEAVETEITGTEVAGTEITGTSRSVHENEYKPPYPEDDDDDEDDANDDDDVEFAESEEAEPVVYSLRPVPASSPRILTVVLKYTPISAIFDRQRREFRRRYLLQKIRHRLGLFAAVLLKVESPQPSPSLNESDMNEQSLQEYGAAVLDGRPPFVRKEPHYAYQTSGAYQTNESPPNNGAHNDVSYPDPKTGVPITLRWLPENTEENGRFGVSYTEFLNRDKTPLLIQTNLSPQPAEPPVPVPASSVVRTSLNASQVGSSMVPLASGLEECFEESRHVGGSAVSLSELFRVDSRRLEESAEFQSLDSSVQRQLEVVIRRITKAAEKIEQAAEASGLAGRHISQAAELVETEVRSAMPTYKDLFRQWSEFQEMISAELETARKRSPESLQFRTLPRRQVMIERAVPTIDVEMLLR